MFLKIGINDLRNGSVTQVIIHEMKRQRCEEDKRNEEFFFLKANVNRILTLATQTAGGKSPR